MTEEPISIVAWGSAFPSLCFNRRNTSPPSVCVCRISRLRGETLPVPPSTHATPHQLMTPTASTLSAVPLWGAAEGVGVKLEHVYPLPLNGTTALDTTQRTVRDDGQDDRCLRALPEIQVATSANPTGDPTRNTENPCKWRRTIDLKYG